VGRKRNRLSGRIRGRLVKKLRAAAKRKSAAITQLGEVYSAAGKVESEGAVDEYLEAAKCYRDVTQLIARANRRQGGDK